MASGVVAALVAPVKNSPGLHYKNPRFPLNIKLPDNLECGTKIYVHGAVASDANRFTFNLKNAETDANTFFHFNPRFGDANVVVRNSKVDEAWGEEERDGTNPFVPGEPFLFSVKANVDAYEVEVNGQFFTTFNHREGMPLCGVTHITMGGDVTVYGIHVPLVSMPIPLVLRIPKKIFMGDMIFIKGHIPSNAERFIVNLQCGSSESADIMFHFNPRFGDNVLVCNNRCADSWDSEERTEGLPFGPGDNVTLCITASKESFMVSANGVHYASFGHRLDMTAACTLLVDGDIKLEDISIDCPPIRLPPQVADINVEEYDEKACHSFHPNNPITMKIRDSFRPGKMVFVSGIVEGEATRFKVNLQCGENEEDGVALHFNPRWDSEGGPVLVLNTLDEGSWGEEVRQPNTMEPASKIDMHIMCRDEGYCVLLDGDVVIACFPHRLDCGRVTHVQVDGCLAVTRIFSA